MRPVNSAPQLVTAQSGHKEAANEELEESGNTPGSDKGLRPLHT